MKPEASPVPRFAVLMATHNGADVILRQLTSIASQVGVEIHLFVSDDGSSDATVKMIEDFAYEHNEVTVTFINREKVFGRSAKNFYYLAMNVRLDDFEYVAFADQDDVWFDKKLFTAAETLWKKSAHGYSSDILAYWPDTDKQKYIKKSYPQTKFDYFYEPPGPGCTQVFTVGSFREFQKFLKKNKKKLDSIDCHDWLVYAYYRKNGFEWTIDDKPTMYYYQHGKNEIGVNVGLKAALKRVKKLRSGWYRKQVMAIRRLLSDVDDVIGIDNVSFTDIFKLRRRKIEAFAVFILIRSGLA
jgi:rhamnosyltransferase